MSKTPKIYKRTDGNYYFCFEGKKYVRSKRSDAENLRTALCSGVRTQQTLDSNSALSETIEHSITRWFKEVYSSKAPSTYDRAERVIEKQIIPQIGSIQVGLLTNLDVRKMINNLFNKGLSESTVKKAVNYTQRFYKDMGFIKSVDNDIFDNTTVKPKTQTIKFYTREEIIKINQTAETIKTIWLPELFIVMSETGMREGEVAALSLQDLDFANKFIHINKTVSVVVARDENSNRKHYVAAITPPKTEQSIRVVPMSQRCESALKSAIFKTRDIIEQNKTKPIYRCDNGKIGLHKRDKDYFFITKNGCLFSNAMIEKKFKGLLYAAGMNKVIYKGEPKIYSPHALRHSFATYLINVKKANIAKVSKMLGHKNIKVTVDTYVHTQPEDLKELTDLL